MRRADLDVDSRRVLFHDMARSLSNDTEWDLKEDKAFKDLQLVGGAFVREKRVVQGKTKRMKEKALSV